MDTVQRSVVLTLLLVVSILITQTVTITSNLQIYENNDNVLIEVTLRNILSFLSDQKSQRTRFLRLTEILEKCYLMIIIHPQS